MFRPPYSLLSALAVTTVVVTATLSWAGWRLLDQQRALDDQRAREHIEASADAVAAGVRGKLAETGERLSVWLSNPEASPPILDDAAVVTVGGDQVVVAPVGGLPFVPVAAAQPVSADVFSVIETLEFGANRLASATERYRTLTHHSDARVRAGAWLRLARVLRKSGDVRGAQAAYEQLTALGTVTIDEVPSELVGLNGQRVVSRWMGEVERERAAAAQLLEGLDAGRWLITRGVAEFYREAIGASNRPDAWWLADALSDTWRDGDGSLPPRGQRVFRKDGRGVLVVWRSSGQRTALLAAFAQGFLIAAASGGVAWQLADPVGQIIAGDSVVPARSVARVIGNTESTWTLHVWSATEAGPTAGAGRATLLVMMAGMLVFVWGAAYFMGRAIRREAAVARLQSDFVAAVSHEFRSPLTTVRQMAEMLEMGRLPTEERRQQYYTILAGEAARLQRLVETLLTFGSMEAGSARYALADVDAETLVRHVVAEIEPLARESGRDIELVGPGHEVRMLADHSALSIALRNLVDNAIKYSPTGSAVSVGWGRQGGRAAIWVTDRGVGVPASEQRAIFRKFVRGRSAIDGHVKGTGVGLSMVQQIVQAHHGEIRLDSQPGRGSTFTILLPLDEMDRRLAPVESRA